MCPLCLLQHLVQLKEKNMFILAINSTILYHAPRFLFPRMNSFQQDRSQRLPNEFHVWPHTIYYIQYHFWYNIHQFSMPFHVQGHSQFWNVLSSFQWLWYHFQTSFHKNMQSCKNHILGYLQRTLQGKQLQKYHCFINKTQKIHGNDRGTYNVLIQNSKTSQYAYNSAPHWCHRYCPKFCSSCKRGTVSFLYTNYNVTRTQQCIKHFPYRITPKYIHQFLLFHLHTTITHRMSHHWPQTHKLI